ncbi:lysozyme inhibitor LprI family protein [Erwinia sp. V71]|uniref:lysozyme inhibitor LprI family protein n=1 Tax=Erwinia sp. V71 TaxID=3369424 RepID=UPI003F620B73
MRAILICCGLSLSFYAFSGEKTIDLTQKSCLKQASSTHAMVQCYDTAYQAWDTEMNNHYHLLLTKLNSDQKNKLRQAQRDWLSYRDSWLAATKAWYLTQQGSMASLSINAQAVQLVKNQALMLQSLDQGSCANPDDC